jgi:hypothetical protein
MKQLKVRFARPEETEQILEWLKANSQNYFGERIFKYPSLKILCAYEDSGEPVAYLPIHNVLMMESIAVNPKASNMNKAQALRDVTKACELIADGQGMREIYFVGGHGGVGEMADSKKGHSFKEVILGGRSAKVYRNQL